MRPLYLRCARRATRGLLCGCLLMVSSLLGAHPSASIDARLHRQGSQAELRMRLTLRDLRHLVEVDRDGDGRLAPAEILEVRDELERALAQSLRLEPEAGTACRAALTSFRLADLSSVEVQLRFTCAQPLTTAVLHSGLFGGSGHRYLLRVLLVDEDQARELVLTHDHNRAVLPAPARARGAIWLGLGAAGVAILGLTLGWRWRRGPRR